MILSSNLLYAVKSTIEDVRGFKFEQMTDDFLQEFEKLRLSLETKRLFQWYWFSEDIDVGSTIYSWENILKYEKENHHLKSGIIQIGWCRNGDEIFLRDKDTAILYWSHDESEEEEVDNEDSLFLTFNRVESLFVNICNNNFIPWDSYSAREYFEILEGK